MTDDSADMFSMIGPEFMANPYAFYKDLRGRDPVLWVPGVYKFGAWVVTGYAACGTVLRSKLFCREGQRVVPPEKLAQIPQENTENADRRRNNLLFRDPPFHTRLRGLVNQAFTPRTIERLRPHIEEIAEHLLDNVEQKGRMDLIHDFAFQLPIIVIAELLGVPAADRDRFKAWSTDLTASLSPTATREELSKIRAAVINIDDYITNVIEERRREPQNDLISDLIQAQESGDKLNLDEMIATCRILLTAGHETTINLIGNGALALLRNPEQREALAADPAKLPRAVEELFRYDSPVQMTMRFALEDSTLGSHEVKKGDVVNILLGAANHDPEQFPDPERLDIGRANAHSHLSLGGGIHYCLGAALARIEGEIAIGALLRRMPRLALATEELTFRRHLVMRGLMSMPVTF